MDYASPSENSAFGATCFPPCPWIFRLSLFFPKGGEGRARGSCSEGEGGLGLSPPGHLELARGTGFPGVRLLKGGAVGRLDREVRSKRRHFISTDPRPPGDHPAAGAKPSLRGTVGGPQARTSDSITKAEKVVSAPDHTAQESWEAAWALEGSWTSDLFWFQMTSRVCVSSNKFPRNPSPPLPRMFRVRGAGLGWLLD